MDKMWASFLKDGDVLSENADLFIKSVPGKKASEPAAGISSDHLRGLIF